MEQFTDIDGTCMWVHDVGHCAGVDEEGCPIHAPSDHPLRDLPLVFRRPANNEGGPVFNRRREDGTEVPDPDSLAYYRKRINAVICLECDTVIESKHQHDFVQCPCGNVAVDGGHAYKKRSFRTTNFLEL